MSVTLTYDRHGKLDADEVEIKVTCLEDGWIENAYCYSEALGRMIDCTETLRNDNEWNQRVVQDFCEREQANASDKHSAAEDHDYFREGRGA